MSEDQEARRATIHQVANLLAVIETQVAVVRAADDPDERGRRAVQALEWIEQSARSTQRLLQMWRHERADDRDV